MAGHGAKDPTPWHIEAVYNDAVDNIRFVKRQQWAMTYYGLLINAAIYALARDYTGCTARVLLTVLAAAVAFYGATLIFVFQDNLGKFRSRIAWIYEQHFTEEERKGLALPEPKSFWYDWPFFLGLVATLLLALAIVTVRIWLPANQP